MALETVAQRSGSTVLISVVGDSDAAAEHTLGRALDSVTEDITVAMIDTHEVPFMDVAGLLLVLDLHRRAECMGLRVLVVGWQPQPQQLMAEVAGIPGPGSATGERYAVSGFRRLIEERAERRQSRAGDLVADLPSRP
ncbi:STAS domain-containing protein [Streptomyces sp. MS1.HAVA.3]|uniref:STAS domain-containing protein n=1 Tax=Streptomyces caledonius TaxID=3134107 RepID=A0ABU8U0K1_9ACTN